MVIVLSGVAGAGKTTIGQALARRLQFEYFEGDDFHPPANRAKMHAGTPLTDDDREPWLLALSALISDLISSGVDSVLACSALRRSYRDLLARDGVRFVYLQVPFEVACERLQKRTGHFFEPHLLATQFEALEEPEEGIAVDAAQPVDGVVEDILRALRLDAP